VIGVRGANEPTATAAAIALSALGSLVRHGCQAEVCYRRCDRNARKDPNPSASKLSRVS
jgi:hypothetical protein